jgi:hypothetical protein
MIAVRMVEMAIDEIVDVVAVPHLGMAAAGTVNVPRRMTTALVRGRAGVGIDRGHFDHTLVDVIAVSVVQVAVVQIVDVPIVFDGQMSAARSMLVLVVFHFRASSHLRILHFRMTMTHTSQRINARVSRPLPALRRPVPPCCPVDDLHLP